MSLTEVKLFDIVKRQYFYKLKANMGLFSTLMIVQIIALLFSFNGVGNWGMSGSDGLYLEVKILSGEIIFAFTALWAFIIAQSLTTDNSRNRDFVFISNRLSSNLSNIVFLLTMSIAGGVTVSLGGVLLRVIAYFFIGAANISNQDFLLAPFEIIVGIIVNSMYLFLCSALGYFYGFLTQLYKSFMVILPILFFGILIFEGRNHSEPATFIKMIQFYGTESSFVFFTIKFIVTAVILLYGAFLISNRLEVRR